MLRAAVNALLLSQAVILALLCHDRGVITEAQYRAAYDAPARPLAKPESPARLLNSVAGGTAPLYGFSTATSGQVLTVTSAGSTAWTGAPVSQTYPAPR